LLIFSTLKKKKNNVFCFSPGCHFDGDFFSYSCFTALILKIASPTANSSWSLVSSNDSTYRQKVSPLLLGCFRSKALSPGPLLQGHAIAIIKKDGGALAYKQQYRNHQGKTAIKCN